MLSELPINHYLDKVASGKPTPGGGSICALAAAAGAALAAMVAGLTIGRKQYATVEPQIRAIQKHAGTLQSQLLNNVDRDARAYGQVLEAFKLPRTTKTERTRRADAIQTAFKQAALVPLEVAEQALQVMELAEQVMAVGNPNAVTDGVVGTVMARSAAVGAIYNVRANLNAIDDNDFAQDCGRKADQLEIRVKQKVLDGVTS